MAQPKPIWRQWVEAIVAGTAAFSYVRMYLDCIASTGSAEPNILVGDRLFGNKVTYLFRAPRRALVTLMILIYDCRSHYRFLAKYIGFPILGILARPENWVKELVSRRYD